jgi:hypothetical protein
MDAQHQPRRLTSRILAALFLIAAGTTGVGAQHAAHTVDDDRERIVLPAPARNMVLAECG